MGGCICKEPSDGDTRSGRVVKEMVKVVTSTGDIMELYAPITASCVTDEFPGHALFPAPHPNTLPLPGNHHLRPGGYYYLLPLHYHKKKNTQYRTPTVTSKSNPSSSIRVQLLRKASDAAVDKFSRCSSAAKVWKVRLVISPDELSEILAHEARTQALIDSVRAVAGSGIATPLDNPGPAAY